MAAATGAAKDATNLHINTNHDAIDPLRRLSATSAGPRASSSLSSNPTTPARKTSPARHAPFPTAPHVPSAPSPRPNALRRTSSSTSLNRQQASPNLVRKGSRGSLGGPEDEKKLTPKRSISNLINGLREAQTTMAAIEEPIPLTAAQIASQHFARELDKDASSAPVAETIVVLHDACYGHRYSRSKTSKTSLSLIVERPERLSASILGASTAYVRLGGHHAEGPNAPHPDRSPTSIPPFHIHRSRRTIDITSACVSSVHGLSWMTELKGMCSSAGDNLAAGVLEIARQTEPRAPPKPQFHEGDLYLASASLEAFEGALGGVADAVDKVFEPQTPTKRAFVAVRPPGHHCSADYPSGFCWLNNVHVGIEYAAQTYGLTHAAIFDFDLHHGDGSQAITWHRNSENNRKRLNARPNSKLKLNPDIGYYSIHDINSYPCENGDDEKVQAASLCIDNAHGQSIWNVHLQSYKTEDEFWSLYENQYRILFEKARKFLEYHANRIRGEGKVQPRAAIFISAGFDASEWEGSGMQRHKVNVPTEFYARFTKDVVKLAEQAGTSCNGRIVSVLEGGYSDRALFSGVLSHLSGLCASNSPTEGSITDELGSLNSQLNSLSLHNSETAQKAHYDKSWWSAANLNALEMKVNPPPPVNSKKSRLGPQPTYATPTESFAYKVVNPNKFARSISGTMRESPVPTRPPTPPPPEVEWVVATQELSNLLIPQNRQTTSCTPEELAGTRVKKDPSVESTADSTTMAPPRQLRERRSKTPAPPGSQHSDDTASLRSYSRSSRRETIDVLPVSNNIAPSQRRTSRRLSAGSSLSTPKSDIEQIAPPVPPVPSSLAQNRAADSSNTAPITVSDHAASKKPKAVPQIGKPTNGVGIVKNSTSVSKSSNNQSPSPNRGNLAAPAPADVDGLTSGLKKITLKVSATKEEHDRKQKEKTDAERRARALKGAETRKVNALAKKAANQAVEAKPTSTSRTTQSGIPIATQITLTSPGEKENNVVARPQFSKSAMLDDVPNGLVDTRQPPADCIQEPKTTIVHSDTAELQGKDQGSHVSVPGQLNSAESNANPHEVVMKNGLPKIADDSSQSHDQNSGSQSQSRFPLSHSTTQRSHLPVWSSTGPIPFSTSASGSDAKTKP